MENANLLLFAATVLPLICTPGPDILFVASQTISGGAIAGLRSTAGICIGYIVHSTLAALGVAAIIAAFPLLFMLLRWIGIAYLAYLAARLISSSLKAGEVTAVSGIATGGFRRGFLTSVLNPKGMMIYFAILPQFINHDGNIALQASLLSSVFIGLCAAVNVLLSLVLATIGSRNGFSDRHRRWTEGIAGCLLLIAASRLAA
ncbi:LysE family translocator [Rhizobium sp. P40RR-XXII]|uniref:LysE family translocator n=1 Tax=unclassified Rhizobium TaxID=2613769 RepID=UPI0014568434|nr:MULTISPECIES: LysE family translocator [unclassified Rhizobium]NLR83667.1 LysE family translocator [Rhizobium sp. P28RR-XV]NLS16087.1 LysE family translocator [Rhizobium sp. P40RR-XXII]